MTDRYDIELDEDPVCVGRPIVGRVVGGAPVGTVVLLRARELRVAETHENDEATAPVRVNGAFQIDGPLQPSFFGENFSIEWELVVRVPHGSGARELAYPIHVVAPNAARALGRLQSRDQAPREERSFIVLLILVLFHVVISFAAVASADVAMVVFMVVTFGPAWFALVPPWRRSQTIRNVEYDPVRDFPAYHVAFMTSRPVVIERVVILLRCVETHEGRLPQLVPQRFRRLPKVSGVVLTIEEELFAGERRAVARESLEFEGTFELPDDAPYALRQADRPKLTWRSELWLEYDGGRKMRVRQLDLDIELPRLLEADG